MHPKEAFFTYRKPMSWSSMRQSCCAAWPWRSRPPCRRPQRPARWQRFSPACWRETWPGASGLSLETEPRTNESRDFQEFLTTLSLVLLSDMSGLFALIYPTQISWAFSKNQMMSMSILLQETKESSKLVWTRSANNPSLHVCSCTRRGLYSAKAKIQDTLISFQDSSLQYLWVLAKWQVGRVEPPHFSHLSVST